jgi:enoyl-CoA hydratase/carnithine racemase
MMGKPRKVNMSPLFNYRTLKASLDKSTKSLRIKLKFQENEEYFSKDMISELDEVFNWLAGRLEIQTVIFSSSTNHFSRGLSLKSYILENQEELHLNELINSAFAQIRSFNRAMMLLPQVFVIDYGEGATGCGFEFGIGADLRLAHKNSKLSLCSLDRGHLPMSGGVSLLEIQIGLSYTKKWNFLPTISQSDLISTGYITSYYNEFNEIEAILTSLSVFSPTARIQMKGCLIQSQIEKIEKVYNLESNYGLPVLHMNEWKSSVSENNMFNSVTEIANILTEKKSEVYKEL